MQIDTAARREADSRDIEDGPGTGRDVFHAHVPVRARPLQVRDDRAAGPLEVIPEPGVELCDGPGALGVRLIAHVDVGSIELREDAEAVAEDPARDRATAATVAPIGVLHLQRRAFDMGAQEEAARLREDALSVDPGRGTEEEDCAGQ